MKNGINKIKHEIGFISSIICENMFDKIKGDLNLGVMATHELIVCLAINFEVRERGVIDWGEESLNRGLSDYEECILQYVSNTMFLISNDQKLLNEYISNSINITI